MIKKSPLITIITVVKNDEKKIEKTILSVLNQEYKNIEHIVIDGKSSDGTIAIIKKYKNKLIFFSNKDKNLWQAMNRGIKKSSGSIIGILNSGDVFYPKALTIVSKYFNDYKIDFLFGAVKKNKVFHLYEPEKIFYRFNIYPSHSCGFFIKKNAQKKVGYYNENLEICSDYDLFYKMITKYKMKGTSTKKNEVMGKFDMSGLSSRQSFLKTLFFEIIIRYRNGQNFLFLFFLFFLKIFNKLRNLLF